tara:strand:+ start:474 stop:845 length:372 start_codon:yes stop_codon:yes gene_type:complete
MNKENETLTISVMNDAVNDKNGDYCNKNENINTNVTVKDAPFELKKKFYLVLSFAICLGIGVVCIVVSLDEADTTNGGQVLTGEYLILFAFGVLILLCIATCCSVVLCGRCCDMCCNLCVACN